MLWCKLSGVNCCTPMFNLLNLMFTATLLHCRQVEYYNRAQYDDPGAHCPGIWRRLGGLYDGGWDVCLAGIWRLTPNTCLVYSFGVGNLWQFVETLSDDRGRFRCRVRAFDPSVPGRQGLHVNHFRKLHFYSMGIGGSYVSKVENPHGWTLRTLHDLRHQFKEDNRVIDILKVCGFCFGLCLLFLVIA